jgi:hypothetical protein
LDAGETLLFVADSCGEVFVVTYPVGTLEATLGPNNHVHDPNDVATYPVNPGSQRR